MKPTIPEVLPLVKSVYEQSAVGCCLHIVLDDDNIEDSYVKFCKEQAQKKGHALCEQLADKLLLMSKTQRLKLSRGWWRL